jgi:hypothetical protein
MKSHRVGGNRSPIPSTGAQPRSRSRHPASAIIAPRSRSVDGRRCSRILRGLHYPPNPWPARDIPTAPPLPSLSSRPLCRVLVPVVDRGPFHQPASPSAMASDHQPHFSSSLPPPPVWWPSPVLTPRTSPRRRWRRHGQGRRGEGGRGGGQGGVAAHAA